MGKTQDIEILIATMDRDNLDFLNSMFPKALPAALGLLVINQSEGKTLVSKNPKIRVVNSKEKGLSKSRNLALKHAKGTICVFADDDVVFRDGFAEKIHRGFSHFPKNSFIGFRYKKENGNLARKYPRKPVENLSWMQVMNVSSIEMAIKRADIVENKIWFDEHFGLNGQFEMGEEQVFLGEVKKKGLKLGFFPETLNTHENPTSTEKLGFRERYFIQGAVTTAIFKKAALFWIWLKIGFDIKHKKLHFKTIFRALQEAKKGKGHYLKLKK